MANSFWSSDATVEALLQEGLLEQVFHHNLRQQLNWRELYAAADWNGEHSGRMTQIIRSRRGTTAGNPQALAFGAADPSDTTYEVEQWPVDVTRWADTMPIDIVESGLALADLIPEGIEALAHGCGKAHNRFARFPLANTALAGQTTTGTTATGTSIHVGDVNGFCFAKAAGNRLAAVSGANPLKIYILHGGTWGHVNCTGVVLDTPNAFSDPFHQVGPGTLTIQSATTTAGDLVVADTASFRVIAGGGLGLDTITAANTLSFAMMKTARARLILAGVPPFADGAYRFVLSPDAETQIQNDTQLLLALRGQGLNPDDLKNPNVTGKVIAALGCLFVSDAYCDPSTYPAAIGTGNDFLAAPTANAGGVPLGVAYMVGAGTGKGDREEVWKDSYKLNNPAGFIGKVGDFGNWAERGDGLMTNVDRNTLILRAPLNKVQDAIQATWVWLGAYSIGTDFTSEAKIGPFKTGAIADFAGANSAYKRAVPLVFAL